MCCLDKRSSSTRRTCGSAADAENISSWSRRLGSCRARRGRADCPRPTLRCLKCAITFRARCEGSGLGSKARRQVYHRASRLPRASSVSRASAGLCCMWMSTHSSCSAIRSPILRATHAIFRWRCSSTRTLLPCHPWPSVRVCRSTCHRPTLVGSSRRVAVSLCTCRATEWVASPIDSTRTTHALSSRCGARSRSPPTPTRSSSSIRRAKTRSGSTRRCAKTLMRSPSPNRCRRRLARPLDSRCPSAWLGASRMLSSHR